MIPPAYYYLARAEEGLGSPGAKDAYKACFARSALEQRSSELHADPRRYLVEARQGRVGGQRVIAIVDADAKVPGRPVVDS